GRPAARPEPRERRGARAPAPDRPDPGAPDRRGPRAPRAFSDGPGALPGQGDRPEDGGGHRAAGHRGRHGPVAQRTLHPPRSAGYGVSLAAVRAAYEVPPMRLRSTLILTALLAVCGCE